MTNFVDIIHNNVKIGEKIIKVREAKGFTQKQMATMLDMDQSQYSKIKKGKTDPSFSAIEKIPKALWMELSELFKVDEMFKNVNSYDRTLIEKLEVKEKQAFYSIPDALIARKKLKDTLSNAINMVS